MMKNRTPWKTTVVATFVLAFGITACSAPAGSDVSAGGQTLTVAPGSFPTTLDQHTVSAEAAIFSPLQHVMQPLVIRDDKDPTQVLPGIAETWELTSDTTWKLTLADAAVFSDGTPVTSADAAASIERVRTTGGGLAPLLEQISNMDTSDDKVLIIETDGPVGTLLNSLSLLLIGPADRIDDETFWEKPIGSGQFVIDRYSVDQELVLVDNENWWGEEDSDLTGITFRSFPEASSRLTALSNGEVDIVTQVSPDSVPEVESMDNVVYEQVPSFGYSMMWFNSSREPFTDPNVRRAMWHAVDVESIVEDLLGDYASVPQAPIPQTVFGAPQLEQYEYNPELAKELLAEAGFPDGFETTIQWTQGEGSIDTLMSEAFIADWAEIGVTVKAEPKERAVFLEDFNSLNWNMNMMGNNVATGDADYTLGRLYLCEAERNGYCNEQLDEILLQAKAELDQDVRKDLYRQASEIIWNDAVGIFPRDATNGFAYSDAVSNLAMDPANRNSFASVTINRD